MSLRELRAKKTDLAALTAKAKKIGQKNSFEDPDADTYWKPTINKKTGKFNCRIRFLPAHTSEDDAWVQLNTHNFQGPGGWYINNCLSTLGKEVHDPMVDYYVSLDKDARKAVQGMKTKRNYIFNILVLEDDADPSNNGKVFRYKAGQTIMDMVAAWLAPDEGEEFRNPFDPDEGMVLNLVYYTKDKFGKYDKSKWEDPSPLADTDEEMDEILSQTYKLAHIVAADKFKTYDELKARVLKIMELDEDEWPLITKSKKPVKTSPIAKRAAPEDEEDQEDEDDSTPFDPDEDADDDDDADLIAKLRAKARGR